MVKRAMQKEPIEWSRSRLPRRTISPGTEITGTETHLVKLKVVRLLSAKDGNGQKDLYQVFQLSILLGSKP